MPDANENAMDPNALFREENFTDQKIGAIRKLVPVTANGADDPNRAVQYMGSAQIMSPMGPIPLNFELAGNTIGEAADDFAEKAQVAIQEASQELERMRREQASQIVVPGQGNSSGIIT